jgi:tetraacyldisaccharide 4'-kinase
MRERLGKWREELEQFVLEAILGKRRGKRANLLRGFLFALSKLFIGIVAARRFLYQYRIFRDHTLGCLVVSVGNLTVGGTGKTPVVEKFARALAHKGRKVAILSRGYKSVPRPFWQRVLLWITRYEKRIPPRVVSDGHNLLLDSEQAGDEPYMLASNLPEVIVLVDKDRVKSGRYAIEKFKADTLILDDGFQHWSLKSRLNLVLVDRTYPFGNQHLLPRGTLREAPSALRRASHVFITKSNGAGSAELRREIKEWNPNAQIIECTHHPLYLQNVFTGERKPLEFLKALKIAALSGIAMPDGFEQGLEKLGAVLVHTKQYADHHRYSQQEILNMINRSKRRGAQAIITTEKDAVRFPKLDRVDVPIYFLRVEIKIIEGAKDFDDAVNRICFDRA